MCEYRSLIPRSLPFVFTSIKMGRTGNEARSTCQLAHTHPTMYCLLLVLLIEILTGIWISSSCKNHGIYEYIMRSVERSLLLISVLVLLVVVFVLVVAAVVVVLVSLVVLVALVVMVVLSQCNI